MANVAFGTKLSVNDGASQVYVDFDGVTKVTLGSRDITKSNTDNLYQADNYKRWISNKLIDCKEWKVEIQFTETNVERLEALLGLEWQTTSVHTNFKLTTPNPTGSENGKIFAQDGFVSKIDDAPFEKEGVMFYSFEITVTGPLSHISPARRKN